MLIKAELKKVSPCQCPTFSRKELKNKRYIASVKAVDIPRCGTILVADYYTSDSRELQVRFFTDKNNHQIFKCSSDEWKSCTLEKAVGTDSKDAIATDEDITKAAEFFGMKTISGIWIHDHWIEPGITAVLESHVQKLQRKKYDRSSMREYERMRRHFEMFQESMPDYKSVNDFCTKTMFDAYIFFGNLDKRNRRKGRCSCCGKTFSLPKDIRHNQETKCPRCHKKATYVAKRYATSKKQKAMLCTAMRNNGQLLIEWSDTTQKFTADLKPIYNKDIFARTLYLYEKGKAKIYSYGTRNPYYYNGYWCKWGHNPVRRKAFVYTGNLDDVFDSPYYNVNIRETIETCRRPIDFVGLLNNIKNIPACEYLCKLGLTELASELRESDMNPNGHSFGTVLGVNPQYVALYKASNVNEMEHRIIRCSTEYITPELLERYRCIENKVMTADTIECLRYMKLSKLIGYAQRQVDRFHHTNIGQVVTWMKDYIKICESLGVHLNRKNLFPADIKSAHDIVSDRYTELRNQMLQEASKEALRMLNQGFKGYTDGVYTVLVPQSREDFLREGQELSHCVGGMHYYENHIKGEKMIFFIRKAEEPTKAYVTAEIDMVMFNVTQLYGYGDKPAPKEVQDFTRGFAKWLKMKKNVLRNVG